jgi:hypothetical protein
MPALMMSNIYQIYLQGNDIYLSIKNNTLQHELMEDEFGILGLRN